MIGKLGDVLWSFAQASQLSTQYADSTVQGREIARVTAKEEDDWTTIKWSQQVHAFLVEINKSAEGVLEAAKEEVKERTKVVIDVGDVGESTRVKDGREKGVVEIFLEKITEENSNSSNLHYYFSTPHGYDGDNDQFNMANDNPTETEISLITRLAFDSLDRDLTYAEWALVENVVKMKDEDEFMTPFKTGTPREAQKNIKQNTRFLKAREIWNPVKNLSLGPRIPFAPLTDLSLGPSERF